MPIYDDYARSVQGAAASAQMVNDMVFESTIWESGRASADYFRLAGKSDSESGFFNPRFEEGLSLIGKEAVPQRQYDVMTDGREQAYGREMLDRRLYAEFEDQIVEAGGRSLADIDSEYEAELKKAEDDMSMAAIRGSTAGHILGSLAGGAAESFTDPVQLITMPFGLSYKGGSLLKFAVQEAAVQGAIAGGTESYIAMNNRQMLERADAEDPDGAFNILAATFGGAMLGTLGSVPAAKMTQAKVNRAIRTISEATGKDADDAILDFLQQMERTGYMLDARQRTILSDVLDSRRVADSNLAGRSETERSAMGRNMDAVERQSRGEGDESTAAEIEITGSQVDYDLSETLDLTIRQVQKEINARAKIERRPDAPSKPMKQLQASLEELRRAQKAGEIDLDQFSAQTKETLKRIESKVRSDLSKRTRSVMAAMDSVAVAAGREGRAQAELRGARMALDRHGSTAEANQTKAGRPLKEWWAKRDSLRARVDELEARVAEARAGRQDAEDRLAKEQKAKRQAEQRMNEAYSDRSLLDVINESQWGFKWRTRKAEKGEPVRPPRDVVNTPSGETRAAARPKSESQDNGLPDEKSINDTMDKAEELVGRIDNADMQSIIGADIESLSRSNKMKTALREAIACNARGA